MNKRNFRAGLFACLMATASALALSAPVQAAAPPSDEPKVSKDVGKFLEPAQKLLAAKDYAGALDLIKQAQAVPTATDADKYVTNEFLGNVAIATHDYDTADQAYEAMADSPLLPASAKSSTFHNAMLLANQAKHYDKAIKYGQAYLALTPGAVDPTIAGTLALAYYFVNDFANAQAMAQKALDASPAGQPPNRGALDVMLFSQSKAHENDAMIGTLEKIVSYYDDKSDWADLIDLSFAVKGIKDIEAIHIYRLRLATHAGGHADAFTLPAQLALTANYPVEAQAFLDAGNAAGAVPGGGPNYGSVRQRANQDRSVAASFAAIAHKAATGELDVKLAETYYGYGQYAEAAAAAQEALQKGGAKVDANEAKMVLGEALAMQGKTAEAIAAFNSVSNPTPGWAKAQHLWLIYANRKYTVAAQ